MADYQQYKGKVLQQKIIKAQDPTLAWFQLETEPDQQMINAILAVKPLTFMLEVQVGDTISIYGHYNQKKQFVVRRYLTAHALANQTTGLQDYPPHLSYPKSKNSRPSVDK